MELELPARATYKHTLDRVLSMSHKALCNRVRAIERCAGMYAIVKMRMFAEVLILEGYADIAELAEAALTRLLELPKFAAFVAKASATATTTATASTASSCTTTLAV